MTVDEYMSELVGFGLYPCGEPYAGSIPCQAGDGRVYVLDTSQMSENERRDWFEFQKANGQFTQFGY